MFDFLRVSVDSKKKGPAEVFPEFIVCATNDLMIRGSDFYAIWDDELGLWSTDPYRAIELIDNEIDTWVQEHQANLSEPYVIKYLKYSSNNMIDRWLKFTKKQLPDNWHELDAKLVFSNDAPNKKDYASHRLNYSLIDADTPCYDKLMSVLYSEDERHKIEWAIGSIVAGKSKSIQKFMVLYGSHGTGKSTVLNIINRLFDGYCATFEAKALGSNNAQFSLEPFKNNPLVGIQQDGDLSRIEDNSRLNSLVSHEKLNVNEKHKSLYEMSFNAFLFMGTNRPVRITDSRSGIIRRLIDVEPTGNTLSKAQWSKCNKGVDFELGAIAKHCLNVFNEDPDYYDDYIPVRMIGASNDFYNFILENYDYFREKDGVTLKQGWEMYKTYCDFAKISYTLNYRNFKEELMNYFEEYHERYRVDGQNVRSYFHVFKLTLTPKTQDTSDYTIDMSYTSSLLDKLYADCPAQYGGSNEKPVSKWDDVETTLADLETSKLHYVLLPENHIVVDFDLKNEKGEKDARRNLEEASKFLPTYAEYSKSGGGIHLHYIYDGDVKELSTLFAEDIEIKTFTGKQSLRRKLSFCNNLPIAVINTGLPLKEKGGKNVNFDQLKNEKAIRTLIRRNLNKEIHASTKQSCDFIHHILSEAYASGMTYDVSDMRNSILTFAAGSSHQSEYCIKLIGKMKFKSADAEEKELSDSSVDMALPIAFYDVEVFPNLFVVCWKLQGEENKCIRMINPSAAEIENLIRGYRLIGFNNRKYDNHIIYARLVGYSVEQLYRLSQRIVTEGKGFFSEAYNLSYTDVYDFCSKKQSLKKWEIQLDINHYELGLKWDEPVDPQLWDTVAEYCDNDVIATEKVFESRYADFIAREILSDIADMSVNDTTNNLTAQIIFGSNRRPQDQFNYRFLGDKADWTYEDAYKYALGLAPKPKGNPWFPGYTFERGKSIYRGEEIGEGGKVYAEPGMYGRALTEDITSMHPYSIFNENLFGDEYTPKLKMLVDTRVFIKHGEFDKAKKLWGGKLDKYLDDEKKAASLAQALKIAINSVYGLTAARFENRFRDPRNKDNIVAKRGALFMTDLKFAVQQLGYTVIHIKTDSIKIADPTPEILEFIVKFGEAYGYMFEIEDEWDRICLVNDAVFVGHVKDGDWKTVGAQFANPYVFKTLFKKGLIKEFQEYKYVEGPIDLSDMRSVIAVSGNAAIYIDQNEGLPDVSMYETELKVRKSTAANKKFNPELANMSDEELALQISKGHSYKFVGKVGQFCPVKEGLGGGLLWRIDGDKISSAPGTKGYRWLETEVIKTLDYNNEIDFEYFRKLVDAASNTLMTYGDKEWFLSLEPAPEVKYAAGMNMPYPVYNDIVPFK